MLDGLLQAIENLQNLSFEDLSVSVTDNISPEILDLVKEQLSSGIDGEGNPIHLTNKKGQTTYDYAPVTIEYKIAYGTGLGAITEHITLYDTGTFYLSLYVYTNEDGNFEILSNDPKQDEIFRKSGGQILKLTEENLNYLRESYIELFQERLNEVLSAY